MMLFSFSDSGGEAAALPFFLLPATINSCNVSKSNFTLTGTLV